MDDSPGCDLPSDVEEDGADVPADVEVGGGRECAAILPIVDAKCQCKKNCDELVDQAAVDANRTHMESLGEKDRA
eukprot:4986344-Pyramimonas_sp.AAC.1